MDECQLRTIHKSSLCTWTNQTLRRLNLCAVHYALVSERVDLQDVCLRISHAGTLDTFCQKQHVRYYGDWIEELACTVVRFAYFLQDPVHAVRQEILRDFLVQEIACRLLAQDAQQEDYRSR